MATTASPGSASPGSAPGRDAFSRQAWRDAYDALTSADEESLDLDDVERLAVAAYLVGEDDAADAAWERAHHACIEADDADRAVRCAMWIGITQMLRGDAAHAGGWFARAGRLMEEHELDSPASGYVLIPEALQAVESDPDHSYEVAEEIHRIGRHTGDPDLLALGTLALGQAAVARGDTTEGMALFDEVMVAVTGGEVSPIPSGIAYCAVLLECASVFDVRRAAEWTGAFNRWCEHQPDLVPYRGQCLVHRSEVLQQHGEWRQAAAEAERARERLAEPPHPALALACYQRAELHRLRGEFADAEAAYREASRHGRDPAPGLPLLRLAEGKTGAAEAAIRRALDEAGDRLERLRLLGAAVEILLAAGDIDAASAASAELSELADQLDAPLLHALADHAAGAVLITRDDASAALPRLRSAHGGWRELDMPYDAARTRMEIGRACRALGDHETADLELDAARAAFSDLDAAPALGRLDALGSPAPPAGGLTEREREVLRLVAAGRTNRQVADELVISEHTVARHVQNIFAKLDVSSRSAATAYAYEHDLA